MKTSLKNLSQFHALVSKAVLVAMAVVATCSSITQATAEGGGAHNGPDTSGIAMSSQSDISIRLRKINEAILSCQREMIEDIATQVIFDPSTKNEQIRPDSIHWNESLSSDGFLTLPLDFKTYSDLKRSALGRTVIVSISIIQDTSRVFLKIPSNKAHISLQISDDEKTSQNIELDEVTLPSIIFDSAFSDAIPEEFGSLDYGQIAVKNLKIFDPSLLSSDNASDLIALSHANVGSEVGYTVNLRNYRNCLVNGIQQ